MATAQVKCPYCGSENVIKNGKDENGKQKYLCKNKKCTHGNFLIDYDNHGCEPEVKEQILKLTVNGNGTRAIARALGISTNTVTAELKKKKHG
jgi:transposase-like protein